MTHLLAPTFTMIYSVIAFTTVVLGKLDIDQTCFVVLSLEINFGSLRESFTRVQRTGSCVTQTFVEANQGVNVFASSEKFVSLVSKNLR